jgi:hypothetical protein
MNANNAVIFEGATADAHETTLTSIDATADRTISLPNVSGTIPVLAAVSTTAITSTPEELNVLDGITAVVGELNALDIGSTAVGTAVASKAVILDSNKDYTGVRNFTLSGELDAGSLDVSGDADIDGTLEADAITVGGVTLAETIQDTVGAMVSSNTESGITVAYQDADGTLDFTVTGGVVNEVVDADGDTKIQVEESSDEDTIRFDIAGTEQIVLADGVLKPTTDSDVDLGTSSLYFKDAYIDTITTTGVVNAASLDISGAIDVDGTTNLDVVDIDGAVDMASTLTVAGVLTGASLDISGDIDVDGTTNLDVVDIDGAVDMASTLAVGGTATFTGLVDAAIIDGVNFKVNGGQGNDGQVLTSTGSGAAWEDAGGGVTFKAFGTNSIMVGDDGTGTISGADNNTALGLDVFAALTSGTENTAVGFDALSSVTDGGANVAVGKDAGKSIIGGSNNVVLGKNTGSSINTGSTNICIGVDTGDTLTSGNNNILLGNTARTSAAGGANQISMGLVVTCVGDNNFTFGNQSTDSNIEFGATSITAPSDIRLKEDIQDETIGLDFLNDLRPVTFIWKKEKDIPTEMKAYKENSEERTMNGKYNHGFIAQEVKASIEKHGLKNGFDMWQEDEADGRQRVAPSAAVPLMIKAIQELSTKVNELQEQLNSKE